nr:rifin PIR protein,putative [Plasmodium sp. DRC-Itaito]
MKLHYPKILLFALPLNILLILYVHNNKNKPSITPHYTPIYTPRVLSECDTQSSNYDKDTGMKSVMQQFVARTSHRFEEYKERMKDKRQKRKEERDKNIQKIIEKDKREKSLAEKVEKGCLKCGCALGGGVLPVWGLVSGIWYAILSQHATKLAIEKGIKKGLQVGIDEIKNIFRKTYVSSAVPEISVDQMIASGKFNNGVNFYDMVKQINTMNKEIPDSIYEQFFSRIQDIAEKETINEFNTNNGERIAAVAKAFEDGKAAEFAAKTGLLSNTIIASVVAIVVIVLVMVIIYLVLRYRRKKKMKRKAQYTKLLNQ